MHSPFAFFTLYQNIKTEDLALKFINFAIEWEWQISISWRQRKEVFAETFLKSHDFFPISRKVGELSLEIVQNAIISWKQLSTKNWVFGDKQYFQK